ncbi:hypothetical protein QE152_g10953 [Popillia japonica]|uniref:Uncharacterized protein n=1 Tax=Popillia japonica TaxID=7064 RepID=A0AAW1LNC1_POPJA
MVRVRNASSSAGSNIDGKPNTVPFGAGKLQLLFEMHTVRTESIMVRVRNASSSAGSNIDAVTTAIDTYIPIANAHLYDPVCVSIYSDISGIMQSPLTAIGKVTGTGGRLEEPDGQQQQRVDRERKKTDGRYSNST